jgi:hypothetical protein
MKFVMFFFLISFSTLAQNFGPPPKVPGNIEDQYLNKADQKYFKNEAFTGLSESQRTDRTVKEINGLHQKIINLEQQIELMKKDIEELKKK